MRLIANTLLLLLFINAGYSQTTLERRIVWNTQSMSATLNEKNFLWFENAIYLNPETMAPSYFELISIDNIAFKGSLSIRNEQEK